MCRTALPRQAQRVSQGKAIINRPPFNPEDFPGRVEQNESMDRWHYDYDLFLADFYFLTVITSNAAQVMKKIVGIPRYSNLKKLMKGKALEAFIAARDTFEHFQDKVPGVSAEADSFRLGFDEEGYFFGHARWSYSAIDDLHQFIGEFIEHALHQEAPVSGMTDLDNPGIGSVSMVVIGPGPDGVVVTEVGGGAGVASKDESVPGSSMKDAWVGTSPVSINPTSGKP